MSSLKLKHSGGNSVIIAGPSSNPAADRTLTCPDLTDNATIATTNGIIEYDTWRLAANYTIPSSSTTITESYVRPTLFFEKIGTGMSVSSGVFTFPSTGKWEVEAFFQGFQSNGDDNIFKFNMDATSDNSSWQEVVNCREGNYNSGRAFSTSFAYLIDITNTTTHKVRFGTTTAGTNRVQLDGNSAGNVLDGTYFNFKRIGDT